MSNVHWLAPPARPTPPGPDPELLHYVHIRRRALLEAADEARLAGEHALADDLVAIARVDAMRVA